MVPSMRFKTKFIFEAAEEKRSTWESRFSLATSMESHDLPTEQDEEDLEEAPEVLMSYEERDVYSFAELMSSTIFKVTPFFWEDVQDWLC